MNGCTITKTGDGSGGDNSSFYGNNSSIYAGAASSTNYQSTTAASGAKIVIKNVTVNGSAQGANAVIATNGATVEIDGITINNTNSVSRGLHATYGGIITASNVDITTNEATSSTIATCTLSGCTVTVPSGILMYVMADSQWSTSGAVGNLILDNGTYSGIVKYDTGYTANVTVNSGATWNLTADTSIGTLVNNGTINTNGYTLTYTSKSGSGTINETTGIKTVKSEESKVKSCYTLDGRIATDSMKGIIIQDGKKFIRK